MVESRVVVRNAAGVQGRVRLAVPLDGSSVSLHRPQEVRLRSEGESRVVVHVADPVEAWLKPEGRSLLQGPRARSIRSAQ
jgi:hypothetical protein